MRIVFFTILLLATSLATHARADENSDLQAMIGVNTTQLQSCERDADCALIEDFHGCCTWLAVNEKYRDLTADHHSELFARFAPAEKQSYCAQAECEMPKATTGACVQNQCVTK